jgi:transcription elongation factor GreA
MKKVQLTQEGYDALKTEYSELTNGKRQKSIDRLQKARSMGDLSENSEYTAAKEDLAFIEGRIQELETLMQSATIVQQHNNNGHIDIGCIVTLGKAGQTEKFTIVGEFEADPMERRLSSTSPIGSALLGKKKGDTVHIEVPAGKLTYLIVDINPI